MEIRYLTSLRSSLMEAKDVAVGNGIPVTVFREEATPLRWEITLSLLSETEDNFFLDKCPLSHHHNKEGDMLI